MLSAPDSAWDKAAKLMPHVWLGLRILISILSVFCGIAMLYFRRALIRAERLKGEASAKTDRLQASLNESQADYRKCFRERSEAQTKLALVTADRDKLSYENDKLIYRVSLHDTEILEMSQRHEADIARRAEEVCVSQVILLPKKSERTCQTEAASSQLKKPSIH
jgi:hypothetical protein